MFDNPKKELERLQEQLLAAERHDPVDDLGNEFMDEPESDDVLDEELYAVLYDEQDMSRRCAAFGAGEAASVMDSNRYVAAPKKKKKWLGDLLFAILLIVLAAATLIGRWQGWL